MNQAHNEQSRPSIPLSGVVYGEIIYWGTIASAVIALIGQIITFLTKGSSLAPSALISRIWDGHSVDGIWAATELSRPANEHWYVSYLNTGEGLTMFGIALGVFVVIPAILACSYVLLVKEKLSLFALMAFIAALITIGSFLGVIQMPVG
jgi:hypothetical protein